MCALRVTYSRRIYVHLTYLGIARVAVGHGRIHIVLRLVAVFGCY